ncbi:adenylate/guanylate cyclase domain-containing protein [Methylobacterium tardum]|uniref:adenylate/guanylate cyclase domain-containing protein n=1 Tax=Methylobacterium tardum TaxID=374432 RepID=UPI00360817F1
MMGHDEEGTHARMSRYRRDIVEPTVLEHSGTIIKHMGDGFLAVFDSPLEATRCAIVIQQTIAARNAAVSDKSSWLQYRIGINLGDIICEEHDVFGDGVNVAARLQTAARPGDVNISGGVYEQIKNKLVCGYQSLGDERLKNITDPVRIYRVLPDPSAVIRAEHGVKRAVRTLLPIVGACGATFAIGVWFAAHKTTDRPEPVGIVIGPGEVPAPEAAPRRGTSTAQVPIPAPVIDTAKPEMAAAAPPAPSPEPVPVAFAVPPPPAQKPEPPAPSGALKDCADCPEMLKLTGGVFRMGARRMRPRSRCIRSSSRRSRSAACQSRRRSGRPVSARVPAHTGRTAPTTCRCAT